MQAEAGHASAPWTGQSVHALRIDLIPSPSHTAPPIRAESDSARYRGSVNARQPRLIAGERIGLFRIAVRSQATPLEQFWNPFGQRCRQSHDFFIVGSK